MIRASLLVLCLGALGLAQEFPRISIHDRLVFAAGDTVHGTIVERTEDMVVIEPLNSESRQPYPIANIKGGILPGQDPLVVFRRYYSDSEGRPGSSSVALARWALSYELPIQARRATLRAVTKDPQLDAAYRLWHGLIEDSAFVESDDADLEELLADELMFCGLLARKGGAEPLDIGLARCRSLVDLGYLKSARADLETLWSRAVTDSLQVEAPQGLALLRGEAALVDGDPAFARQAYTLATELWPDLAAAWFGLAEACFGLGDIAASAAALETCDELGGTPELALATAAVSLARGDLPAASAALAAERSPTALYLLGLAAALGGDLPAAESHFAALEAAGEDGLAKLGQGFIAEQGGALLDASAAYADAASALEGGLRATAYLLQGRALAPRGALVEALHTFSSSLANGAPLAPVLDALIAARLRKGDRRAARIDASLKAASGSPDALAAAGRLLLEEGELYLARTSFEAALARDPGHLAALRGALYVAYQVGPRSAADQALAQLLALSPEDAYGLEVQRSLERVDTQLLFAESFDREADGEAVLNGWEEDEDDGLTIAVADGACMIEGTARGENRTRLYRPIEHKPAHLQVSLDRVGAVGTRVGIEIELGRKWLRFFVDPDRGLMYQIWQDNRAPEPVAVPVTVGTRVRLGIDLPTEKRANIGLLVDGQQIAEVKMSGWQSLKKSVAAVYVEGTEGQDVRLEVPELEIYIYRAE